MKLTKKEIKKIKVIKPSPRLCPKCEVQCEIGKPFLIITQIACLYECPQCDYGGIIKLGAINNDS
ncbi:hypothetical protein LCGC14_0224750 [marine sediment metagenome]|uniref:Uncharacterized protein n=1 Tax=marine sediment metagenome TaxID=412755 RepID=A0A0F9WWY1_9ZZZZ|nr:hypothetical protein [bacterium]